jgi:hypothetical protein
MQATRPLVWYSHVAMPFMSPLPLSSLEEHLAVGEEQFDNIIRAASGLPVERQAEYGALAKDFQKQVRSTRKQSELQRNRRIHHSWEVARLNKRYDISGPFSSFVTALRERDLLVAQGRHGVQTTCALRRDVTGSTGNEG